MAAAAPSGAIPANPVPQNQLGATWRDYQSASTGTNKKVWGGIAITLGSVAVAGAIVAIVLPFFANGAPNVLNMGKQLGNAGGLGSSAMSFSATVGTVVVAGTIIIGGAAVIVGAVFVRKGRKEEEEKEALKERFANDGVAQFAASLTADSARAARTAFDEGVEKGKEQGLREAPAIALDQARTEAYRRGQTDGENVGFARLRQIHEDHGVKYTDNPPGLMNNSSIDYSEVRIVREAREELEAANEELETANQRLASIREELARQGKTLQFEPRTGAAVIKSQAPAAAGADDSSEGSRSRSHSSGSSGSSEKSST
jgi:hypothetical protein